jgi:hypothetical protein
MINEIALCTVILIWSLYILIIVVQTFILIKILYRRSFIAMDHLSVYVSVELYSRIQSKS